MKYLLFAFSMFLTLSVHAATTYTEFYCNATAGAGTNLNAGSTTDSTNIFGPALGNWTNATCKWFASGSDLSKVSVGQWASVYTNNTTIIPTNAVYIARILAVDDANDVITLSTSAQGAYSGTAPPDDLGATGATMIRVGGCWAGPHHASGFPFNFIGNTATNAAGIIPRVNLKNSATYSVTANMPHGNHGPVVFQGYSTAVGDYGKATIDAGNPGTSFTILTLTGNYITLADLIFSNNGSSLASDAINAIGATHTHCLRCVAHHIARSGFYYPYYVTECEAYACNQNNGGLGVGGFMNCSYIYYSVSHDHTATATAGFVHNTGATFCEANHCISYNNGGDGFYSIGPSDIIRNSDFYLNKSNGVAILTIGQNYQYIQNCNFLRNGVWGITNLSTATLRSGLIQGCGFGSGTAANTIGDIAATGGYGVWVGTNVTYAADVQPWASSTNGNFSIVTLSAKSAGRAVFLPTSVNSISNTVGYSDIGAAESSSTNTTPSSTSGASSHAFIQ